MSDPATRYERNPLRRYLLWQLPGWAVAAAIVGWAVVAFDLPAWAWGAAALPIAKDLLLYPAARKAFGPPQVGPTVLIGAPARAVDPLAPSGYVRVRGELWRAVLADAAARAPAGAVLVVRAVRGLTLVVEPAPRGDG